MRELINQNKLRNFNLWIKVKQDYVKHKCSMVYHIVARKAIVLMTVAFLRSKGLELIEEWHHYRDSQEGENKKRVRNKC